MNIKKYQEAVLRTVNNKLDDKEKIKNFCFGLGGETGEVLDLFKKHLYHGHELNIEKLKYELGDILWYIANISNIYDINLEDIFIMNIEKLNKRYPKGFDKERSRNRTV